MKVWFLRKGNEVLSVHHTYKGAVEAAEAEAGTAWWKVLDLTAETKTYLCWINIYEVQR